MELENILSNAFKQIFREAVNEALDQRIGKNAPPKFEDDRISKSEAAKLAQVSLPTLDKLIKAERFKQYNVGHRKYFLRSEMLEALRKNN